MELRKFVAKAGNVYKHKITGSILSNELYLGIDDDINNYEEVLEVVLDDEQRTN